MAAAQEEPDRPELSPEELEAYARDGFLVRRGFLDEGQLDQLGGPVFRAYRDHSYPETEAYPQHGAALHLGSRILADHPSMAALSLDHPSIVRIVEQILDLIPNGDFRIQDKKVTPPPRARIDESMEALIHHFKIFTEGFHVPEGETYAAVESPRGELGCYLVSDGGPKPYRMHIRGPSFVNLQTLPHLMEGGLIADGVAVVSSVDPIMGEVDR